MAENYPHSGHGVSEMNTMLYLFRRAEEAEAELRQPTPEVSESEIDAAVNSYLESRKA